MQRTLPQRRQWSSGGGSSDTPTRIVVPRDARRNPVAHDAPGIDDVTSRPTLPRRPDDDGGGGGGGGDGGGGGPQPDPHWDHDPPEDWDPGQWDKPRRRGHRGGGGWGWSGHGAHHHGYRHYHGHVRHGYCFSCGGGCSYFGTTVRYYGSYGSIGTIDSYGSSLTFVPAQSDLPSTATPEQAWTDLADGRIAEAWDAFAELSARWPDDASMRLGLGLASALLGDHRGAVLELRVALAVDARILLDVPVTEGLSAQLEEVLGRIRSVDPETLEPADQLFLIAATSFLVGDDPLAYFAIDAAISQGDEGTAAKNMKTLVEEILSERLLRE